MGFFNLVKEDDTVWVASNLLGQLSAFIMSYIARRTPKQACYSMWFHILRHIQADQVILSAKQFSGNCFGLSREDAAALAPAEFKERRAAAMKTLERAGAHYVIDSVADLMPIVQKIEERLARGDRP